MPVVAALPMFLVLFLLFVAGAGGLVVYGLVLLARVFSTPALPLQPPSKALRDPSGQLVDDLRRTPARLLVLEDQLAAALLRADQQTAHLRGRRGRMAEKEGREELLARYDEDVALLTRRVANMKKVMALLWRTRAVLELRAHVAITARARPELSHLPEGDVPTDALDRTSEAYDQAVDGVRAFVAHVESRSVDLRHAVPRPPDSADVSEADRSFVDAELARTQDTYASLQDRMDRLADTLGYLADRCRTRSIVAHADVSLDTSADTEGLLSEVADALHGLHEMTQLGDRQLADSALDNLEEDISQLERAGLDAQAAAEAELEIARLLQSARV